LTDSVLRSYPLRHYWHRESFGSLIFVGTLGMDKIQATPNTANVILRLPAVKRRTGLYRSMIYLLISRSAFRKVSLGARAIGFVESEVDDWIAQRIESSRADERGARQ
jgi:prophage regulatory protein